MSEKVTAPKIKQMKGQRIVCLTAYDFPTASIADEAGVDLILVGDSAGNVIHGFENTLPVSMEQMLMHVSAVKRAVKHALVVADMPFGSYQKSSQQAVENAILFIKSGAEAVKLEGSYLNAISEIVKAGIPVMGHIGMTPQSVNSFGGFRVQGRGEQGDKLLDIANEIAEAGAFSIVLEMIPAVVAEKITKHCKIPTIGIGAGIECDGEVQVWHDILGFGPGEAFKHSKRYMEGRHLALDAVKQYAQEVRSAVFPTKDNSF